MKAADVNVDPQQLFASVVPDNAVAQLGDDI
jgi:hypothetical protein